MSNVIISPNMLLPVPIVTVDPGPDWAQNINACLQQIDQHNHSSNQGVQIQPSGLNINSDLPFNNNNATLLRSARFSSQLVPITASLPDLECLYVSGVDLFYNDGSGNQIQITASGNVAGAAGTITGLPSGTAGAAFGASTFVFTSATNTAANIDVRNVILRNSSASSKGLTLSPPTAMAADYGLVLPAIPVSLKFLTLDTSGNIATASSVSAAQIASASITGAQMVNNTITATQIANGTITTTQISGTAGITGGAGGQIASNTITGANLVNAIALPGIASADGKQIIGDQTGAPTALSITRGIVAADGTAGIGIGYTSAWAGTPGDEHYAISFSPGFSGTPAVVVGCTVTDGAVITAVSVSGSGMAVYVGTIGGYVQHAFHFIAVGPHN